MRGESRQNARFDEVMECTWRNVHKGAAKRSKAAVTQTLPGRDMRLHTVRKPEESARQRGRTRWSDRRTWPLQ